MANNQKFTLTFDAQLNVNQMKGALSQIQSTLNGLKLPYNLTKGLQGTFDNLVKEVQNFEAALGRDITSKADFKKLDTQASKIIETFERLKIQVRDLTGLSGDDLEKFLPTKVITNIKDATKAIGLFEKQVKDTEVEAGKAQKEVNKISKEISDLEKKKPKTNLEFNELKKAIKAVEEELDKYKKLKDGITLDEQTAIVVKPIQEALEREKAKLESLKKGSKEWKTAQEEVNRYETAIGLLSEPQKKKIEEYNIKIKEIQENLNKLKQEKLGSIVDEQKINKLTKLNQDLADAKTKLDSYNQALTALKDATSTDGGFQQLIQEISQLTGIDLSNFTGDVEDLKQVLEQYKGQALGDISGKFDQLKQSVDAVNPPIKELAGNMRDGGNAADQYYDKLGEVKQLKSRIQYFFGLNNTIQLVKRTIRSAISTIKDLDAAMTETAVVTDFTVADMWAQLPQYTQRANELGVATKQAYEAATLFYQQGLKTNEVMAVSNETLKMARIAGLDAATSTDRMTNALRGFNMAINEVSAQRINDVYSRLAAISASNVDEISTAMTKVASLASSANMEFETTAAFLSKIVETTRESAETAGTALKTVIARFSEVKKLYSEDQLRGTDEEGSVIDVNKISQALRTAGIDLNRYFLGEVGLDDIFMELAKKWDSLTSVQQRYIATQAAGSRQQSRFIALMQDYGRTQELVGEAYNSNGAAAKQFEKTQDSLQSKLAKLKNAWDEFAMGILNSDLLKLGVDILTLFIKGINELTSAFGLLDSGIGGVINSITKLSTLILGLKAGKGIINKLFAGTIVAEKTQQAGSILGAPGKNIGKGIGNAAKWIWSGAQGLGTAIGTKFGMAGVANSIVGGGGVLAGITGLLPVIGVFAGLGLAVNGLVKAIKSATLDTEQFAKNMSEVADAAKANAQNLKTAQSEYSDYTEKIDQATTSNARIKAIKDRNEYITSLLEQNAEYQKYLSSTFEGGQIKLVLDEDAIANAVEKAAEVVRKAEGYNNLAQAASMYEEIQNYTEKLAHAYLSNGETALDENKEFLLYENLKSQAESEMLEYAKQGISNLMTNDLLPDELADGVAQLLAQQFSPKQFQQEIITYVNNLDKEELGKEELIRRYKNYYNAEPSEELKENTDALKQAIATYEAVNNTTQKYVNNLESILTNPAIKDQFAEIILATSGKGKINELNLSDYIKGDTVNITGLYKALGVDTTAIGQLDTVAGDYIQSAEELIAQQAKTINAIQKLNKSNIFKKILQSGNEIDDTVKNWINELNPQKAQAISDILTNSKALLSEEKYDYITKYIPYTGLGEIQNEELNQIQDFFNNFNLDDPIKAFINLNKAEGKAAENSLFANLLSDIRQVNESIFESSNLVKTFIYSADYDELTEQVHELVDENGKLTPKNIEELAKSSKTLNTLIKDCSISTRTLAKTLSAIDQGAPLEGLTQAVFDSIDAIYTADDALADMYDTIDNFDTGRSYGEGTEFIAKQIEAIQELIDKRSFGGEQFKNIYTLLFGEKVYEEFKNQWGDRSTAELAAFFQEKIDNLSNDINYDSFGFMTRMAEAGELGISFKPETNKEDFNWDIGTQTTQELIQAVQKQTGYSEEVARMLINGWREHSLDFAADLDENNFLEAVKKFNSEIKKYKVITQQELEMFAKAYGQELEVVQKEFEGKGLKVVDFINIEDDQDLFEEAKDVIGNTIQQLKNYINDSYLYDGLINTQALIKKLQDDLRIDEATAKKIAQGLVDEINNQLPEGKKIKFGAVVDTIEVDEEGNQKRVSNVIKKDTIEGVQQGIEDAQAIANYQVMADRLADAIENSKVSDVFKNAVKEGVLSAFSEVQGIELKAHVTVDTSSTPSYKPGNYSRTSNTSMTKASGDSFLTTPGWALTGEEGPEIVWNKAKGYSYITGQNGPEFRTLEVGDRIFNAQDTSRILKHSSFAKGGIFGSYVNSSGGYSTDYLNNNGRSSGGSGSKPTNWRNELDWLYNLMEDIAELERTQTKLQEQHDRYLQDISKTGRDLYTTSNEQLNNLRTQLDNQREALVRRRQEMGEQLQASGYSRYVWWNSKDQTIEIDWDAIEAIQNKDTYDAVSDLVNKVEKIQDEMDAAADTLWDIEDTIKEIENRYLEEYTNFQKRIYDAVVNSYQQQIDKLSQLNDTINDSNNAILNSLQHEIELQRQIRDNTDTENNIRNMEARLAYLRRDTTGANESEIRALEKQLDEARKNYTDTLIDQSISRLQENNDKAAEQRQNQISLLTAQLDYWKETGALWSEVATLLESGFSKDGAIIGGSALEQILQEAEGWKAMSEQQREVWANELITSANQAGAYLLKISEGFDNLSAGIWALIPNSSLTTEKYQYATGGLASYTGPAWLDGTPREPEYVLNARQTDAFLRLADVLPSMFSNGQTINTMNHDVYVEFNLHVDEIANDYDVDRLVERVKADIYNASEYRNSNVISFSR